jgi:hypothetical protein
MKELTSSIQLRIFLIKNSMKIFSWILWLKQIINLIKKRGNLSAPGLDGITFPFSKLEKEAVENMILQMMKLMLKHSRRRDTWKLGITILLFKAGDPNDPGSWRPITLTSVIYSIIFGRIYQLKEVFLAVVKKAFSLELMAGSICFIGNITINRSMTEHRTLSILARNRGYIFG